MILRLLKRRFKAVLVAAASGLVSYGLIVDFFFGDSGVHEPDALIQKVASKFVTEAIQSVPSISALKGVDSSLSEILGTKPYDRSEFGSWIDQDGDCQNTRHEILIEQSVDEPLLSGNGCFVKGGEWFDPYSGRRFQDPNQLDIDHIVPLKWAYEAGAAKWPVEKKRLFANDPQNLLAVSARLNRRKGANAPPDWMPPNRDYRCEYVVRFYKVARVYELLSPDLAITLRQMKTKECS